MRILGSHRFRRGVVCVAGTLLIGGGIYMTRSRAEKPLVPANRLPFLLAKAKHEREEMRRFDQPDQAMAFYINKRTGPILTRGANLTVGMRTLDSSRYLDAIAQTRGMPRYSTASSGFVPSELSAAPGAALATWSSLGPSNQGGRTRQLLIDPTNPSTMYAASVGGGVWKSTNGGATWLALVNLQFPSIAVSSLAFDPKDSQTLYAGTGEGFFNGDAIRGIGIFKSTDGGASWTQVPNTNNFNFYHVNDLVISPRSSLRIYAATTTGIWRTNDGGANWTQLVNGTPVNGCTDLAMQVGRASGFIFAACGNFAQGTVYRAFDTPSASLAPVFSIANQGRTSLAIAPSNEAVVYAMSAANSGGTPGQFGLLGVYRSTVNGGSGTWTTQVDNTNAILLNKLQLTNPVYAYAACVGAGNNGFFNQGWYDNVIAVDPLDSNRVWTGGIDLMRSDDGGQNWGIASYWWFGQGDPNYAHADNHAIVFHPQYNGTSNKQMYVGNDGGVFRTDDARANVGNTLGNVCGSPVAGMVTWTELNTNYATTQFYHGTAYPDGGTFLGGTQDNGTWRGTTASTIWARLTGGDGGWTAHDNLGDGNPANDVLFGEYTGLSIQKSINNGGTYADAVTGITGDNGFPFISVFEMDPFNRQRLFTGGWYIWRTTNQAASWTRASAITCGNGSVSAIGVNPTDANFSLVGMSDGCYHFINTALTSTSATAWPTGTLSANNYISSFTWQPGSTAIAYATVSAFGTNNVFKTLNSGASWAPIVGAGITALPQVPARTLAVDPSDVNRLYVGTDIGVFTSLDGGVSWYKEVTGFANVDVEKLLINTTGTRRLFGFTHGRGAWRVDLNP